MKSLAPVDPALPITTLLNSLSDLPFLISIVPANTLFNWFIKWRPVQAICFLTMNCAKIVLL